MLQIHAGLRPLPCLATSPYRSGREINVVLGVTARVYRVVSASVRQGSGDVAHNGSEDGLFKTRGLWVLTQLPGEQERDGREFWLKQLEESGSGVMAAAWNDNGRQRGERTRWARPEYASGS